MRSIRYCGTDFSVWCSAEVTEPCGHVVAPRTVEVPGRAGAVLLGGEVAALTLTVRLFWDALRDADATQRAVARHEVRAALLHAGGGELVLPGDPEMTYRDTVCTGCGDWSTLFADGSAEVEFTCHDPIAYGARQGSADARLEVGGTWATWPEVTMVAAAGTSVGVTDARTGARVLVERAFLGGELVALDFANEGCTVDRTDALAAVAVGSDFFSLAPGANELAFSGCSAHEVSWYERWA